MKSKTILTLETINRHSKYKQIKYQQPKLILELLVFLYRIVVSVKSVGGMNSLRHSEIIQ